MGYQTTTQKPTVAEAGDKENNMASGRPSASSSNARSGEAADANRRIFRPLTQCNIYSYYLPLAGAASYSAFSATVFLPELASRLFHDHNLVVANSLLFNAHIGTGLYLYTRPHLQVAPVSYRLMYSVYGAVLFNFGSVLLWAVTKTLLPDNDVSRAIFSVSASLFMLLLGKDYLNYVDSLGHQ